MTLKHLRLQLRADAHRLNAYAKSENVLTFWRKVQLILRPELSTVIIYRLSHYCFCREFFGFARFFFLLNLLLHGASIQPRSKIGGGCLIVHSPGLVIDGHLGSNATLFGHNIIQPIIKKGRWSNPPNIGDNCTLSLKSSVIGPITVANHMTLGPYSLLTEDIEKTHVLVTSHREKLRKIHTQQLDKQNNSTQLKARSTTKPSVDSSTGESEHDLTAI